MTRELCFVLVPFGEKVNPAGSRINYEAVYHQYILPALKKAGLEPIRPDTNDDIPTQSTLDNILLCDYALVDISIPRPQLYFTLGIRHALKPNKTVFICHGEAQFNNVFHLPAPLSYTLYPDGTWVNKPQEINTLARTFGPLRTQNLTDSSLYLLFDELPQTKLAHEKTDLFRDLTLYSPTLKTQLKEARNKNLESLKQLETEWLTSITWETGIYIDFLLSYRALNGYAEIIALVNKMPLPLSQRLLVQEQLAFAYNRLGQPEQAEIILKNLLARYGDSSETCALLGRIYKDRYERASKENDTPSATLYLDQAIKQYLAGFQADWRDAYPGINAVTLMDIRNPEDPRKKEILPLVTYAVKQKIARGNPDYWDYATLVELAVLADAPGEAAAYWEFCRPFIREAWEPQTTARNLHLIREAREKRGLNTGWITEIIALLSLKEE